jgi:hypothetical protein
MKVRELILKLLEADPTQEMEIAIEDGGQYNEEYGDISITTKEIIVNPEYEYLDGLPAYLKDNPTYKDRYKKWVKKTVLVVE